MGFLQTFDVRARNKTRTTSLSLLLSLSLIPGHANAEPERYEMPGNGPASEATIDLVEDYFYNHILRLIPLVETLHQLNCLIDCADLLIVPEKKRRITIQKCIDDCLAIPDSPL